MPYFKMVIVRTSLNGWIRENVGLQQHQLSKVSPYYFAWSGNPIENALMFLLVDCTYLDIYLCTLCVVCAVLF